MSIEMPCAWIQTNLASIRAQPLFEPRPLFEPSFFTGKYDMCVLFVHFPVCVCVCVCLSVQCTYQAILLVNKDENTAVSAVCTSV